jgi:2-keto-4-pentenoate hydratase/2-oxohepta-3-ene-1,7-dioic acid hydratase in catechol pathway
MGSDPPRWLLPGDAVSVTIEGIGSLVNPVVAEGQAG